MSLKEVEKEIEEVIEKDEKIVKADIIKSLLFTQKQLYKYVFNVSNTIKELIGVYIVILIVASFFYGYFEHKDFWTSLWWASVTSMTVGYGDTYPITVGGRIVAITLMHVVPLLLIPLITTHLTSKFIINRDVWTEEIKKEMLDAIRELRQSLKEEKVLLKEEEKKK